MSTPTPAASTSNLDLMKRGDDAFNARDSAGMDAVHAPDLVAHIPGQLEPIRGRTAHLHSMQDMFRAFPDVHVDNDPYPVQLADGDWTTVVTRATGTFTGEMMMPDATVVPGTGKRFDLSFATTARWRDGLMVEEHVFWDSALMAQQIGLA